MTQVTVVRLAGDAVLPAAQPLGVTGKATGKGGLESDVAGTVTVSFDGGPSLQASVTIAPEQAIPAVLFAADVRIPGSTGPLDILVVATAAEGTTRVRVQVQQIPPPGDRAAGNHAGPGVRAAGRGARRAPAAGGLTGRELEIMLLVAGGKTSRQIGEALFISPRTVEMHVQGSLLKLGCRTRAQAVRRLAESGTLPLRALRADAAARWA